jgi:glycine/D-amino acid oxidase-like deaminating enzyme
MAGIAAAYQLAVRSRVARVILVDPRDPLSLTSSKGAEGYRNFWPLPDGTMTRFMDRSIDLLEDLDRDSDGAFELNRRGYVFLTADPAEAARLHAHDGPVARFVPDRAAIRARFPYVTERVLAMLHVKRAGFLNAPKLGQWLLGRASAHGVELVRDEVTGWSLAGGRLAGVQLASGAEIAAGALVLAAGPLLPQWTARLGLDVPIVNELHGKVAFEDHAGMIPRDAPLLIWNDPVNLGALGTYPPAVHVRPRGDRTLLGIWTYDTRVEAPTFPPAFPPNYAEVVLRGLAAMCPGLDRYVGQASQAIVDGGYYCKAPDNRPLVGPTRIDGVHLLGALSGFGIMASQAAAELLAAHVLGTALPHYAAAFHPSRFHDPAYQPTLALLDAKSGQL